MMAAASPSTVDSTPSFSSSQLASNCLFALPRKLVSQNKRRFQENGYDLDLCYLHPRVIVMGFPSTSLEAMYRNPRSQVQHFLNERHGTHYKVYNFCSEKNRQYPSAVFQDRVAYFPIEDHNVPTFKQAMTFCDDAAAWLDMDSNHIVALHCKAGKGRAGMMACMLLVRMGFALSPQDAIDRYNRTRVRDLRGLTVTSQKKWVHYYGDLVSMAPCPPMTRRSMRIHQLHIQNGLTGVDPPLLRFRVYTLDSDSATKSLVHQSIGHDTFDVDLDVDGAVLLEFRSIRCQNVLVSKHFKIWFHTLFVDTSAMRVIFPRSAMDWVSKDRKLRRFPAAFQVQMHIETIHRAHEQV